MVLPVRTGGPPLEQLPVETRMPAAVLKAFDLVPGVIWALLLAAAVVFGAVEHSLASGARSDLANHKAAAAESTALALRAAADESSRRADAQRKALDEAAASILSSQADLADARAASDGVRERAAGIASNLRDHLATSERSAREQDSRSLDMLVNVLARTDDAAQQFAQYADQLKVAGLLCERSYDALMPAGSR